MQHGMNFPNNTPDKSAHPAGEFSIFRISIQAQQNGVGTSSLDFGKVDLDETQGPTVCARALVLSEGVEQAISFPTLQKC